MNYIPQQEDINILNQNKRTAYAKVEVLNKSFKKIGNVEGELLSDNYSVDSSSDIRRTYNLTLLVTDDSFLVGQGNKIWFDKYLRVYIGLFSIRLQDVLYYPVGTYLFSTAGYTYDSSTKELSLSCVDRMAELTGSRNGKVSGLTIEIKAGADIHDAIVKTITDENRVTNYRVNNINKTVPYDLSFNAGTTTYDIVKKIVDLYDGWEFFFDDDVFICQPYPTCNSDPVVLDAKTLNNIVISENTDIDFSSVHNVIELWGECFSTEHYSNTVTYGSNLFTVTDSTVVGLEEGVLYGFKAPATNTGSDSLKIGSFGPYPLICEGNAPIGAGRIVSGQSYVVKYTSSGSTGYFYFCGQYQIAAIAKLMAHEPTASQKAADLLNTPTTNISYVVESDSPFACDVEGMGEIRDVLSDGEYADIYSEDLATQRAKYELWKATDLIDTITLTTIEIPWLDVNQKIEYQSNLTGKTETYLVKSKKGSTTEGTMTITATKFQPLYSWTN